MLTQQKRFKESASNRMKEVEAALGEAGTAAMDMYMSLENKFLCYYIIVNLIMIWG